MAHSRSAALQRHMAKGFKQLLDFHSRQHFGNDGESLLLNRFTPSHWSSDRIFHTICRNIPSQTSASLAGRFRRRTRRRIFSSARDEQRGFRKPLAGKAPSAPSVIPPSSTAGADSRVPVFLLLFYFLPCPSRL